MDKIKEIEAKLEELWDWRKVIATLPCHTLWEEFWWELRMAFNDFKIHRLTRKRQALLRKYR